MLGDASLTVFCSMSDGQSFVSNQTFTCTQHFVATLISERLAGFPTMWHVSTTCMLTEVDDLMQ